MSSSEENASENSPLASSFSNCRSMASRTCSRSEEGPRAGGSSGTGGSDVGSAARAMETNAADKNETMEVPIPPVPMPGEWISPMAVPGVKGERQADPHGRRLSFPASKKNRVPTFVRTRLQLAH